MNYEVPEQEIASSTREYDPGPTALYLFRHARGLSQSQLADLAGVRQETISNIERGAQAPRRSTAARVAAALGFAPELVFPNLGDPGG